MDIQDKIYDAVVELKEDTSAIKEHLKTLNGTVVKHERKINSLTKTRDMFAGATILISVCWTIFVTFIK